MDWARGAGDRLKCLQAQLFPVYTIADKGFLGSFLSNSLKTTQLEVNTDAKTLRPIARLKEPRDLFALPKERDHECPQQAARWPTECQVLDERIRHVDSIPETPEAYNKPTGNELQPRPVGEENGVVVYLYNPISAVNYNKEKKKHKRGNDDSSTSDEDDDDDDDECYYDIENANKVPDSNENYHLDVAVDDDAIIPLRKSKPLEVSCNQNNKSHGPLCLLSSEQNKSTNSTITEHCNCNNSQVLTKSDSTESLKTFDLPQFSRSSVGGSKYLLNVHPNLPENDTDLIFESRFESGNLAKAVKITGNYYELYLRPDLYTSRHTQWFYFRITNTRRGITYRFSIVNLVKTDSLYNEGMKPLMYSTTEAEKRKIGWRRCGENISYFKNDDSPTNNDDDDEYGSYTLTFNIDFQHDKDTVYFAHSYPYTYTDLQDYLMEIQRHPVKSNYCKLRLLCRSLAGNNVYYLTVTAPSIDDETHKKKRAVIVSARVHPGETPSSWMMKGFMDFITSDSMVAKKLRHKFIFKLIPMLNPDGVIVGNTRNSLTGKDLNRQYRTVIRETYPSIWYTKAMIKRLMEECGVVMYCDMHAHSRKHNIFIYGCENKKIPDKRLMEQVFPLMLHKNVADKFSFENCKFKVQRNKEGTGRIVVWMLGIMNSYTMEASFGGTTLGLRAGTHFSTMDYEQLGRAFCETLMDYYDENPLKVTRSFKQLKKIRRRDRKLRKAAKIAKKLDRLRSKILTRLDQEGSSADEPQNIPLSDYSSDAGDTSPSSSENENGNLSDFEGPCCQPLKVPPSSPVLQEKMVKFTKKKKPAKSNLLTKGCAKFKQNVLKFKKHIKMFESQQSSPKKKKTKTKIRRESLKLNRNTQRQTLDIPTTDPGGDFMAANSITSGDDEESDEYYDSINKLSNRNIRNEYIKKFSNVYEAACNMPPELIIKSAKKDDVYLVVNELKDKSLSAPLTLTSDLPPINSARRAKSWHNFSKLHTRTIQEGNYENQGSIKHSLKKKIWTGVGGDRNTNRPLSWGVPPIVKIPTFNSDAVLEECSQKLAILQQEIEESRMISIKSPTKTLGGIPNLRAQLRSADAYSSQHKSSNSSGSKIKSARSSLVEPATQMGIFNEKDKKKRINLAKIVQTTDIVSRLAKTKCIPSPSSKSSSKQNSNTQSMKPIITPRPTKIPNKFKTGGNVAIAAQPIKKKTKIRAATAVAVTNKSSPKQQNLADCETNTENVKIFVKKVKSKLKKKKKGS